MNRFWSKQNRLQIREEWVLFSVRNRHYFFSSGYDGQEVEKKNVKWKRISAPIAANYNLKKINLLKSKCMGRES